MLRFERKDPRVLREPPFDGLRVVRELEPQDPEGNRGAKAPFDWTQGGEHCRTTKGAKFGKDILTADLRRLTQIKIHRRDALRPIDRLRVVRIIEPEPQAEQRAQRTSRLFVGRGRQTKH